MSFLFVFAAGVFIGAMLSYLVSSLAGFAHARQTRREREATARANESERRAETLYQQLEALRREKNVG